MHYRFWGLLDSCLAANDKQALAVKLYDEKKHTIKQICTMMGISKPTLYAYLKQEK